MLIEKYNTYKTIYKKYLIFMKVGSFYICLNEDAIVLSNIFKFKITESKNFIKCGFPLSSLIKVINRLKVGIINMYKPIPLSPILLVKKILIIISINLVMAPPIIKIKVDFINLLFIVKYMFLYEIIFKKRLLHG